MTQVDGNDAMNIAAALNDVQPGEPVSKVFVSNYSGYQYNNAERFGPIIFMTYGYVPLNDIGAIREKLTNFINQSQSNDYLVLSGHNLLCALCAIIWKEKHGFVNILHYDKKGDGYLHYVIQ